VRALAIGRDRGYRLITGQRKAAASTKDDEECVDSTEDADSKPTMGEAPSLSRNAGMIAGIVFWLVFLGVGDWPYGYYIILRLILCLSCLFLLFSSHPMTVEWQRWVTAGYAVLYNPVFPIVLGEKKLWVVLNFSTVFWFYFVALRSDYQKRHG
jgi:hypothetical protein